MGLVDYSGMLYEVVHVVTLSGSELFSPSMVWWVPVYSRRSPRATAGSGVLAEVFTSYCGFLCAHGGLCELLWVHVCLWRSPRATMSSCVLTEVSASYYEFLCTHRGLRELL